MINNQFIKNLASATFNDDASINSEIADYALGKLKKNDLKIYLRRITKLNAEKTVIVTTAENLKTEIKNKIENMFKNKKINYEINPKLGGGIMIKDNDMIINYTINGIINAKMKHIQI